MNAATPNAAEVATPIVPTNSTSKVASEIKREHEPDEIRADQARDSMPCAIASCSASAPITPPVSPISMPGWASATLSRTADSACTSSSPRLTSVDANAVRTWIIETRPSFETSLGRIQLVVGFALTRSQLIEVLAGPRILGGVVLEVDVERVCLELGRGELGPQRVARVLEIGEGYQDVTMCLQELADLGVVGVDPLDELRPDPADAGRDSASPWRARARRWLDDHEARCRST